MQFPKPLRFVRVPIWATTMGISSVITLLLVGCGGGGTSSTSSPASVVASATRRSALNVYVTDGFNQNYKQVITTLYKIELTTDGVNFVTVFENADGQTLDLSSLSDTALLVSSLQVPSGTYTQARITFGDHFTLVAPGSGGTGQSVAVDSSVGTQSGGQVALLINTPVKAQAAQAATLLVDFKLADFALTGGKLTPKLTIGGDEGCAGKTRKGAVGGVVANLTDTGFDLTGPHGNVLAVVLSDTTVVMDETTGTSGILADGQSVRVQGTVDSATKTISASSVTIGSLLPGTHSGADGTVASVGADGNSFVLTVARARGLSLAGGGDITVQTNTSTQFLAGRHQMGAFSDLAAGLSVHVGGSYDAAAQTLTASVVGLHPGQKMDKTPPVAAAQNAQ